MESVRGQINYVRTGGEYLDLLEYISYEMTPELVMDRGSRENSKRLASSSSRTRVKATGKPFYAFL